MDNELLNFWVSNLNEEEKNKIVTEVFKFNISRNTEIHNHTANEVLKFPPGIKNEYLFNKERVYFFEKHINDIKVERKLKEFEKFKNFEFELEY